VSGARPPARPRKDAAHARPPALRVISATPDRWEDLARLFGPRGACAGCWCMWWRRSAAEWRRGRGAGNQRALRRLVASGETPGLIAYAGREPVGWIAVAPREAYSRLAASRTLKPLDDTPVWSITCFFVAKGYRGRGVSGKLIRGAVAHARSRGARMVEGYPVVSSAGKMPDAFAWTGLPSAFTRAGFKEAARPSRSRRIMRKALRAK
jgi:GNAT superfamily N-acetyltransferase